MADAGGQAAGTRWRRWCPPLVALALTAFAASLAVASLTGRALYADGAYFLLKVLESGGFHSFWDSRASAQIFMQVPAWLGLRLGLTDPAALALLFNLGCFLPWAVGLGLCWRLAKDWIWLPLLGAGAGYLNTLFMAVGEHHVTHALFWPAAFALLLVRPLTPFAAGTLLFAALVLLRSYESLLILGPALAAIALWRAGGGGERAWARAVLGLSALLLLAGGWVALQGTLDEAHSRNLGDFRGAIALLLTDPTRQLLWTYGALALMGLLWLRPTLLDRIPGWLLLGAALAVAIPWAGAPLLSPGGIRPDMQFHYRSLNLALPLGGLGFLLLRRRLDRARAALTCVAALLLTLQALWQLGASLRWADYLRQVRAELAAQAGPIAVEGTALAEAPLAQFTWHWTLPALSILESPGGRVGALLYSERLSWQRYPPDRPDLLPDLSRYGIDYGPYRAALEAR